MQEELSELRKQLAATKRDTASVDLYRNRAHTAERSLQTVKQQYSAILDKLQVSNSGVALVNVNILYPHFSSGRNTFAGVKRWRLRTGIWCGRLQSCSNTATGIAPSAIVCRRCWSVAAAHKSHQAAPRDTRPEVLPGLLPLSHRRRLQALLAVLPPHRRPRARPICARVSISAGS